MKHISFYNKLTSTPVTHVNVVFSGQVICTNETNTVDIETDQLLKMKVYRNGYESSLITSYSTRVNLIPFDPQFFSDDGIVDNILVTKKRWKTNKVIIGHYTKTKTIDYDYSVNTAIYNEIEISSNGSYVIFENEEQECFFMSPELHTYPECNLKAYLISLYRFTQSGDDIGVSVYPAQDNVHGLALPGTPRWFFKDNKLLKVLSSPIELPSKLKLIIREYV